VFDLYRIWCSTFIGFSVRPLSDSVFEVEWILHQWWHELHKTLDSQVFNKRTLFNDCYVTSQKLWTLKLIGKEW